MASKKSRERRRSNPEKKKTLLEKKEFKIGMLLLVAIVVIVSAALLMLGGNTSEENGEETIYDTDNPVAVIDTTMGIIKLELFEDELPITVENFINLANEGFYEGLVFHRIGDDFMIQAGSFDTDGIPHTSDQITFEWHDDVRHVDGAISMASTAAKVGGSNQFFICDGGRSSLDNNYAAFGITIEGIEVVRSIASAELDPGQIGSDGTGPPLADIIINSITIENI